MTIHEVTLKIEEVKNKTLRSVFKGGITKVFVDDAAFDNIYEIRIEDTNLGLSTLCFLDGRPSYQANAIPGTYILIKEVINQIGGGEIIDENGNLTSVSK